MLFFFFFFIWTKPLNPDLWTQNQQKPRMQMVCNGPPYFTCGLVRIEFWVWTEPPDAHHYRLQYNVLAAKYGVECGCISGGISKVSMWWKDLCGVQRMTGSLRVDGPKRMGHRVGNGKVLNFGTFLG